MSYILITKEQSLFGTTENRKKFLLKQHLQFEDQKIVCSDFWSWRREWSASGKWQNNKFDLQLTPTSFVLASGYFTKNCFVKRNLEVPRKKSVPLKMEVFGCQNIFLETVELNEVSHM